MASNYQIAVIPGDGIGREVVPEGLKVLETLASAYLLLPCVAATSSALTEEEIKQIVESTKSEFLIGVPGSMEVVPTERESLIRACVAIAVILRTPLRVR